MRARESETIRERGSQRFNAREARLIDN
jgi:hypothetical protein